MTERAIVIDTSALVASHERDQHGEIGRLHARSDLIAPTLLAFEVGQVVHVKKPGAFGSSAAERAELVETLLDGIELVPADDATWRRIGELAEKEALSFYDAAFLELAVSKGAILLTEDDGLARSAARYLGKARVMRMTR